jgi:hypothetical protein
LSAGGVDFVSFALADFDVDSGVAEDFEESLLGGAGRGVIGETGAGFPR